MLQNTFRQKIVVKKLSKSETTDMFSYQPFIKFNLKKSAQLCELQNHVLIHVYSTILFTQPNNL